MADGQEMVDGEKKGDNKAIALRKNENSVELEVSGISEAAVRVTRVQIILG